MKLKQTVQIFAHIESDKARQNGRWMTVCVDFDGTIAQSKPFQHGHVGEPIVEGLRLLSLLQRGGYHIVILTARKETDLVERWLAKHGFPNLFVTNHKVPAKIYVDDRAVSWSADTSKAEDVIRFLEDPSERLLRERSR